MSGIDKQEIVESVPQKGFFGHPKGLFTLFFTEFWERFSYYGMRAILVFYMYYEITDGGLGLIERLHCRSCRYTVHSCTCLELLEVGLLTGYSVHRKLYSMVEFSLCLDIFLCNSWKSLFFISMVLIVIGTGLLKPNVSSIVGDIYSETDNRRDSGFSIFYMGINMGGFSHQ